MKAHAAPAMSAGTAETAGLGAKPASAVRGAEAPASTSQAPIPAGGAVEALCQNFMALQTGRPLAWRFLCLDEPERAERIRRRFAQIVSDHEAAARALPLTSKEDRT